MSSRPSRWLLVTALWLSSTQAAAQCEPQSGFDLGLAGESVAEQCKQHAYRMAFELGRQIRALRQERSDLSRAGGTNHVARLQVIDRELSQLEGLARIQGLPETDP